MKPQIPGMLRGIGLFFAGVGVAWAEPATTLATPGEVLQAGAEVTGAEVHAEYLRYHLRLADGRALQVEVSARPGGACASEGLYLHPRWELLGLSLEVEEQPPFVAQLCARLSEQSSTLVFGEVSAPESVEAVVGLTPHRGARPLRLRWLHGVLGALILALLPLAMRLRLSRAEDAALLGVTALGVAARLALSPRGMQLWEGHRHLALALAGEGGGALVGLGVWLAGGRLEAVFWTNLLLAMAAPPLAWAVARQVAGPREALLAGLLCAVLPAHLRVAGSELVQVAVFSLSWLAVACALRFARRQEGLAALAAALAAGLALHLLPDALPLAAVVALAALPGVRGAPSAALLGGLVLGGLVALKLAALSLAPAEVRAPLEGALYLDQAGLHPPLWLLLALGGLWAQRRSAVGALLAGWLALTGLPLLLGPPWPEETQRVLLASWPPAVILAALGAAALLDRRPSGWVWLVLLALPHLGAVTRPSAVMVAERSAEEAIAALPEGPLLLLFVARSGHDPSLQGEVLAHRLRPGQAAMALHTWLQTTPLPEQGPTYVLLSEGCLTEEEGSPCAALRGRCTLTPLRRPGGQEAVLARVERGSCR